VIDAVELSDNEGVLVLVMLLDGDFEGQVPDA
jgi:hypothetical protein